MTSLAPERPRGPLPVVEVLVACELDTSTVPRLKAQLLDALACRPDRVVVDLSACGFLDGTALSMLLDAHRQACRAGTLLVLRGASPRVLRILRLAGVSGVFQLEPALAADRSGLPVLRPRLAGPGAATLAGARPA